MTERLHFQRLGTAYAVTVVAVCLIVDVWVVRWAAYAAADPLREASGFDLLYWLALWGAGGVAMVALAGSRLVAEPPRWWRLGGILAAAMAITSVANGYYLSGAQGYLVLYRDVAANAAYAAALTLSIAALARLLYRHDVAARNRMIVCATATVTALVMTPVVSVVVHCTSGDCL